MVHSDQEIHQEGVELISQSNHKEHKRTMSSFFDKKISRIYKDHFVQTPIPVTIVEDPDPARSWSEPYFENSRIRCYSEHSEQKIR